MDSPDQGAKGIPTGKTEYADSVLTITAPALGMKFSGKWQGTDRIQGTFVQGGLTLPLELTRVVERWLFHVHKNLNLPIHTGWRK